LGEPAWEPAVEVQPEWELRGDEEGLRVVNSVLEVAKYFDLKENAVRRWVAKGMPYEVKDGKYFYDIDQIVVWKTTNIQNRRNTKKEATELELAVAELRMNTGMSTSDIARRLSMHNHTVQRIVDRIDKYKPVIDHFKINKADLFAIEQMEYLDHITEEKLQKTSARDLAAMAKMAWEKERVERGESVDNVAVVVKYIKELKAQEDA
jgi:transposase